MARDFLIGLVSPVTRHESPLRAEQLFNPSKGFPCMHLMVYFILRSYINRKLIRSFRLSKAEAV